jgi:hypothetical protein
MMRTLDSRSWQRLETLATVIVPSFSQLAEDERARFRTIIDDALADRPAKVCVQLRLLLAVIDLAPIFRFGRRLGRCSPDAARRTLLWFQESGIVRLRQGFWGLRTLVFMGYYGRVACWSEIGYSPDFDGRGGLGDQKDV